MTHSSIVVGIALGIAVGVAILCAFGMAMMRDTLQRLHFAAPVVSLSIGLIALAVWIDESDPQARIKVLIVALLLFGMNSILTHATARAVRIQQVGRWEPRPKEQIAIAGREGVAGEKNKNQESRG